MKINLCVLYGGRSVEHEISVISALQAMENLNEKKYEIIPVYITKEGEMYTGSTLRSAESYKNIPQMLKVSKKVLFVREGRNTVLRELEGKKKNDIIVDVAFPIVHGTNVEDGALQGYLRTLGLPFVGCDVLASAVGMDKYVMKTVLKEGGFPVLDCLRFNKRNTTLADCIEAVEGRIPYPVIVKPVNLGSSVGISKADSRENLEASLKDAFSYADVVLVERAVTQLREINCSVVGDTTRAEASECEEPFMADEILSYKDKYMSGGGSKGAKGGAKNPGGSKGGMASLKRKVPADLSPEMRNRIRTMAVEAFQHLGCNGVSRIDFMIDNASGELFINEFNTIPGSLAFYLWKPLGVEYRELLDRLIALALKRAREDEDITYSFDTNILAMGAPTGSKGAKGAKGSKA
ncbi:MAG: D-alanine--D-alanine ligase [Clostridia bacterium]|nr:D-alanine--D-alanine ligase [Clostridia bacterium]